MPVLQTEYLDRGPRFVEGMVPDMRTPGLDVSRNVEGAEGIGFGKAAFQGTGDTQVIPTSATATFVGITKLDTTQLQESYPQYNSASIRVRGPVVVLTSSAVSAGDAAYVAGATGLFSSATGGTEIGIFETSGADGDLVVLNLL